MDIAKNTIKYGLQECADDHMDKPCRTNKEEQIKCNTCTRHANDVTSSDWMTNDSKVEDTRKMVVCVRNARRTQNLHKAAKGVHT